MINETKPTILVVDDAPANIHILVEALRTDYEVMVATRGSQAIQLMQSDKKPDLILLDLMMPDMNGQDVCRALKSNDHTKEIPVIFITANTSTDTEEQCFAVGGVDFISKPFSIPVVKARVRTHITLKNRTDMLERMAKIDGLTGIANRRRFDEVFRSEWTRSIREKSPLTVVLADVDNFKRFNDTYGHSIGDKCLVNIADTLQRTATRPGDLCARYGGEEFVILLPNTPFEGACLIAEKFRLGVIAQANKPSNEIEGTITISAGCATITPTTDDNPEALIREADNMLYRAKDLGRNRICSKHIGFSDSVTC